MALGFVQVSRDHFAAHFLDRDFRCPAEFLFGLPRVAEQGFDFGGAEVAGVDGDYGCLWIPAFAGMTRTVAGTTGTS